MDNIMDQLAKDHPGDLKHFVLSKYNWYEFMEYYYYLSSYKEAYIIHYL